MVLCRCQTKVMQVTEDLVFWRQWHMCYVYINLKQIQSSSHGANIGPTGVMSAPDGPHVGPMNFAISERHPLSWLSQLLSAQKYVRKPAFCCPQCRSCSLCVHMEFRLSNELLCEVYKWSANSLLVVDNLSALSNNAFSVDISYAPIASCKILGSNMTYITPTVNIAIQLHSLVTWWARNNFDHIIMCYTRIIM